MPFFTGASNFSMNNVEMNDVQGNYTRNETKNVTNNSDMNNHYSGSTVSKNNTETMNNTIGNGHGNTISFGTGRTAFNGTVEGLTPDLSNLLQTALSSLPGGMPNISGIGCMDTRDDLRIEGSRRIHSVDDGKEGIGQRTLIPSSFLLVLARNDGHEIVTRNPDPWAIKPRFTEHYGSSRPDAGGTFEVWHSGESIEVGSSNVDLTALQASRFRSISTFVTSAPLYGCRHFSGSLDRAWGARDQVDYDRIIIPQTCQVEIRIVDASDVVLAHQAVRYGVNSSKQEALGEAYHEPELLDVRRSVKYGLATPLQLSAVSFAPSSSDILGVNQSPVFVAPLVLEPSGYHHGSCGHSPYSSAAEHPASDVSAAPFCEPRVVNIQDFELLEFLSKGSCGQVYLARDNVSSKQVALKVIRKVAGVWDHPFVKQVLIEEKKIMASLQGLDWFVQLEASWHDTNNIYLAMMYYPTDIESEIIRCETFPADRARFYMVEMIIALDELHKRGIIHRDVKTANILIPDFGLSKDFGSKPTIAERSYQPYWPFKTDDSVFEAPRRSPTELTFVSQDWCGSEMEMAPEIVRRDYYSFGVDYWSAAVTLYAMVTGKHPWSDEEEVALQILEVDIEFAPEDDVSDECKDFISQMLRKDPAERLRIGLDMTSHPTLLACTRIGPVLPPWVPDFVKGHHFFEDWGTIEDFVPGSALSEEEEGILPDFVYTSPDMQCNGIKDESLDGSVSYDPQECSLDDLFSYLFTSEEEDNVNEDELWTFEMEDGDDDARPVNVVQVHSPMISTLESHPHMSQNLRPSFNLRNPPFAMHLNLMSLRQWRMPFHPPSSPSLNVPPNLALLSMSSPELVDSSSLPASPLAASFESLGGPLGRFSPPFVKSKAEPVVSHTNVSVIPESVVETALSNTVLESAVPKLLRFAKPPSIEVTIDFTRPPSFQAILEPLVECSEPIFDSEPSISVDSIPRREFRAISLYRYVVSWLKRPLPWCKKREDASALTLFGCDVEVPEDVGTESEAYSMLETQTNYSLLMGMIR
ncbi:hypothetical protein F5887DRAFT_917380 [Amanita rubescens]|nr:hypothetical protein F5887DRAFT_917380 [Amanita rubescens]